MTSAADGAATAWSWLTDDEVHQVASALRAVTDGPFVSWPRFELLADRQTVVDVRAAWPAAASDVEDTLHVVARALHVVASPHGLWSRWKEFFSQPPLEVRALRDRWVGAHGLDRGEWVEVSASRLQAAELELVESTVRSVATRDLDAIRQYGVVPISEADLYEWTDDGGWGGPFRLMAPPGPVTTWLWEPVQVFSRKNLRVVRAHVDMHAEGVGPSPLTLRFDVDAGGSPAVVIGDLHVM